MFTAYGPLRIRTLEFRENVRYGPAPLANIVNAIRTVSLTLETFTLRDPIPVSYPAFCDVLKALGRCKRLRNLTLPPPYRIGDNQSAAQQRADDALAEFDKMARDLLPFEDRPQLNFLQLIPSAYRDNPRPNTAAMRDPLASEYKWLEEGKCPFNLRLLRELVIGTPVAIQVVLPITRRSLHRLEVCQAFDTRSSWTLYEDFLASPIHIPNLRYLGLAFHLRPSKWLLNIIRATEIETFAAADVVSIVILARAAAVRPPVLPPWPTESRVNPMQPPGWIAPSPLLSAPGNVVLPSRFATTSDPAISATMRYQTGVAGDVWGTSVFDASCTVAASATFLYACGFACLGGWRASAGTFSTDGWLRRYGSTKVAPYQVVLRPIQPTLGNVATTGLQPQVYTFPYDMREVSKDASSDGSGHRGCIVEGVNDAASSGVGVERLSGGALFAWGDSVDEPASVNGNEGIPPVGLKQVIEEGGNQKQVPPAAVHTVGTVALVPEGVTRDPTVSFTFTEGGIAPNADAPLNCVPKLLSQPFTFGQDKGNEKNVATATEQEVNRSSTRKCALIGKSAEGGPTKVAKVAKD
ncbi:hypothetical protein F5879DRAFT_988038 [Lentinula edodes]|nr:hypothetical protein F5879DRAFT_988038 [Lentinula edodes]